jgi:hypothetical protein
MSLINLLIAAISISATAAGGWSVDRLIDRHARIAEAPAPSAEAANEEDEDPKLLY